ncbi:PAC2 family protein [Novipirellula galeiformis]|uniref:PAC2 family protein n=1 Tax=Novipirellula galeiformis TaxID=2528004 RepID=A0A5C6CKM2_9BACT|nr:PAC2 family protein [Novipirellula galeiformis]TWU23379.1 PAC2 family protein [Novipirellula galeiformis]
MTDSNELEHPWLVAVWPGMGHVALSAGYYLMSKLGMNQFAELSSAGLFDIDVAIVRDGLVQKPNRPQSRLFAWKAPPGQRDVIVFIGEAQPPLGKYAFCERLLDLARELRVERVFTFAAMATEMHLGDDARVFVAATGQPLLDELANTNVHRLGEGHVGGLNGVLLAAAIEKGIPGICLLGEMPHVFSQMLYPKASLAVLRVFVELAGIELDFAELAKHAEATEHRLGQLIAEVQRRLEAVEDEDTGEGDKTGGEPWQSEPTESGISPEDERHLETMFDAAKQDRSRAFELKSELDRLGVFEDYEDRFLDLFKKEDPGA